MARLIALAVTFVMMGAPVVTTACEALCAARANDGGMPGEQHSCHHQTPAANETGITSAPHACGHTDDGPSAVGQSTWMLAAPAVIDAAFSLTPPSVDAGQARTASDHKPPLISPPSSQLRI